MCDVKLTSGMLTLGTLTVGWTSMSQYGGTLCA